MLAVGLTGGIGSGKSTVAQIFKVLGIPVFDADTEAKKLMNTGQVRNAIIDAFGPQTYTNGQLNRQVVASIVFSDKYKLEQLNAIVHPLTIAAAKQWLQQQQTPYAIKEAALLFEAGSAEGLDCIVGVYAPRALRLQRVMQRDQVGRQQVLERMSRQVNDEIKMRLCDFVITNNEQQLLTTQVLQVHQQLLQMAAAR